MEFTRKLVKGVNEQEMYGIKLAKLSSLEHSITGAFVHSTVDSIAPLYMAYTQFFL